ncbi:MAG: SCP-like extracellular protein [Hyphomicrobiales bacterium]|nr:SCP-like extracellular protein [Hyphomicrobiales bacterium]
MAEFSICTTALKALALTLGLAGCAAQPPAPPPAAAEPTFYRRLAAKGAELDPRSARDMISLYRSNNGLGALTLDPALQKAAQAQADAMARSGEVSHGRRPLAARLADQGVDTNAAAENISAGYYTMAEAFSGWRESRGHNANMLNKQVRRMGIATAFAPNTKYKVYWALVLAE